MPDSRRFAGYLGRLLAAVVLLVIAFASGALLRAGSARADQPAGPVASAVTLISDPGASQLTAASTLWRSGHDTITVRASGGGLQVTAVKAENAPPYYQQPYSYTFAFLPGQGSTPAVGDYPVGTSADSPTASMSIVGYGPQQCTQAGSGHFEIHDLAADLSRLWVTFEAHCGYSSPATFGEIRYNEPTDPDLVLGVQDISWPRGYVGGVGTTVPINLVNTAATPLQVTGLTIDGPAAADFATDGIGACATVAPGAVCAINARFTPSRLGERDATLTMTDSSAAGHHSVTLGGSVSTPSTVTMFGDIGDFNNGKQRTWRSGPDRIEAAPQGTGLDIVLNWAGSDTWHFTFRPPPGQSLSTTTYTQSGAVTISGGGRGCDQTSSTATVRDIAPDDSRFWATYEFRCDHDTPTFGEVRFNEPTSSAVIAIPTRIDWPTQFNHESGVLVPLQLLNLGGADLTMSSLAVTGPASADYTATPRQPCATLPAGGTCNLDVAEHVNATGPRTATLAVADNEPGGGFAIDLSGSGRAPMSSVTRSGDPGGSPYRPPAQTWRDGPDVIALKAPSNDAIVVTAERSITDYATTFTFSAPPGATLQAGDYTSELSQGAQRPKLTVTDSYSCGQDTGWFNILDLPADRSRAWIVYSADCGANPITGEIRYNEPTDPDVLIAPNRLVAEPVFSSETGASTTVTVANIGSSQLSVLAAAIGGDSAAEYSLSGAERCLAIPVGGSCTLDVTFHPTLPGPRVATLTLTDTSAAGHHVIPLTGVGKPDAEKSDQGFIGSFGATVIDRAASLSWTNPTHPAWTNTVIRGAVAATPPAAENDGFAVYDGRETHATYPSMTPGQSYSFTAFAHYRDGSIAQTSVTLTRVTITLTVSQTHLFFGSSTLLTGTLMDAQRGVPLQGRLTVVGRATPTGTPVTLGTAFTDIGGRYQLTLRPTRTYAIQAVYDGFGTYLNAMSPAVQTTVAATVTAYSSAYRVKHGKPVTFTYVVAPASNGRATVLQEYVSGTWVTVAKGKTDAQGNGTFKVTPKKKGTYRYRVTTPAANSVGVGVSQTQKFKAT
jgi:hypothetical protein